MNIFTVVGARPQFIKAAMVSRALQKLGLTETLVHTGQHYDTQMSAIFFEELNLQPPAYNLGISGLHHGAMTGQMLEKLEQLLLLEQPDWVLVYGDTNSTLAGALAAAKLQIPIAHVEAGMRSFNRAMPEEINRVLVDHLSSLLLVTDQLAADHLKNEGITQNVHVVGDVMKDAVQTFCPAAASQPLMARLGIDSQNYILVTLHRAENTDHDARLRLWLDQVEKIASTIPVVFPVHPRTRAAFERLNWQTDAIQLIEPLSYHDNLSLIKQAALILTDSGGMQKEAYYLSTPCITLRTETEWTETLKGGWNQLIGSVPEQLFKTVQATLKQQRSPTQALYGDGHSAEKIARLLL